MAFSSFDQLRKNRGAFSSQILKEVEKLSTNNNTSDKDDDRFWQPEVDKVGNGSAVIRFLPAAPENDYAWVRVFKHSFKNEANGRWYIEDCNSTINEPCYCCERNSELWNTGTKENQDIVRTRKRKLSYIANVLIVRDAKNPENEGKIFMFKFGKKIFDKIKAALEPKFEDETPINPFDLWEGANFKLKITTGEDKYRNYDSSTFDVQSAISDDDEEIERIWKGCHDLRPFVDPTKFKSVDDQKKRWDYVFGSSTPIPTAQQQAEKELDSFVDDQPEQKAPPKRQERETPAVPPRNKSVAPPVDDDDESAYFAGLLDD